MGSIFIIIGTHRCLPRIIFRINLNFMINIILVFTVREPVTFIFRNAFIVQI